MPVVFYGHSATEIKSRDGATRIFIDPWLKTNPLCPEIHKEPKKIDLICLTHGHEDHASEAVELSKATGAKIVALWDLCDVLKKDGVQEDALVRMNIGGTYAYNNFKISMTPAIHSSSYTTKDGTTHYAGLAAGFVIQTPSGVSIYHAGDTALFSDIKLIEERYHPNIALLPCGDRVTMNAQEAAIAAGYLKAKFIIPIHYKTFPILDQDPIAELTRLVSKEQHVIALQPGEEFSLKAWEEANAPRSKA